MVIESSPPGIALVTTALAYGGAETQVVQLALLLRQRGWRVEVIVLRPPQAFLPELMSGGVTVYSLAMARGRPDPRAIARLARRLRCTRPQIVHSHMVHANLLARLARPLAAVPVLISTAHNICEGARWREWAYRLTDVLADVTTNVSEAAVRRYYAVGAVPQGRLRYVPNGVDAERFRPDPAARARVRLALGLGPAFVWLAVGRFEPAKAYPVMLRAFAAILRSRPDVRLVIAGDGSGLPAARALAGELAIGNSVRFLGLRHDIAALMNAADAFVLSSHWEGLPLVLLEAGATGLPIVATAVGGNAEAVAPDGGLLVPPSDRAALAHAMLDLMELPATTRRRMGQQGRAHVVQSYSLPVVVDRWEALYRHLLARRGADG